MVQEIAPVVQQCLNTFVNLSTDGFSSDTTGIAKELWQDELGRFRIWAGNIGAHRTGQSSLDSRLRDASLVRAQILRVLNGIQQDLDDLDDTISSQDDYPKLEIGHRQNAVLKEAEEVYRAIQISINRLFDISLIIRKPIRGDVLRGALQESVGLYDQVDRHHVRDKFRDAATPLQERLAAAITQRRKELKYYERHRKKLGRGLELDFDGNDPSDRSSTAPTYIVQSDSSIPDDVSTSGSSYASTLPESLWISDRHSRMPKLPTELKDGRSGECPYCWRIVSVTSEKSWAGHVFDDLRPYVCLFSECAVPNRRYVTRRDWLTHMQDSHFQNGDWPPARCPLCMEDQSRGSGMARHIGRHLIDLAIWALPHDDEDEDLAPQDNTSLQADESSDSLAETIDVAAWNFAQPDSLATGGAQGERQSEEEEEFLARRKGVVKLLNVGAASAEMTAKDAEKNRKDMEDRKMADADFEQLERIKTGRSEAEFDEVVAYWTRGEEDLQGKRINDFDVSASRARMTAQEVEEAKEEEFARRNAAETQDESERRSAQQAYEATKQNTKTETQGLAGIPDSSTETSTSHTTLRTEPGGDELIAAIRGAGVSPVPNLSNVLFPSAKPEEATPKPAVEENMSADKLPPRQNDLLDHWEIRHTPTGRAYFVDHTNQTTSWVHPASISIGGEKAVDGRVPIQQQRPHYSSETSEAVAEGFVFSAWPSDNRTSKQLAQRATLRSATEEAAQAKAEATAVKNGFADQDAGEF